MDPSDSSSDDGDHLHTPLQLPDSNTTIASHSDHPFPLSSSSSNDSTDSFHFSQSKYLHSSQVLHSISPFFASEHNSRFEFSAQLSSSHPRSDLAHNALQLDSLTSAYQSDLSSQSSDFSIASSCESVSSSAYDSHEALPSVPFPPEPLSHTSSRPRISHSSRSSEHRVTTKASAYSRRFPRGHHLNPEFVRWYKLGDELGAGGYGFVMTAVHRLELREVAVKFIIKAKVPEHAWMKDKSARRVPTEALLLGLLEHPNIVKCVDLFEDELYFYLVSSHIITLCAGDHTTDVYRSIPQVQELHGTPWVSESKDPLAPNQVTAPGKASSYLSTPALTPSPSADSDLHVPDTPPPITSDLSREPGSAKQRFASPKDFVLGSSGSCPSYIRPSQPVFSRRPSHDLFECIEQSKDKRLSESQARFVFAQVVEAVHYLNSQGVTHCDIKDENILVDSYLNVRSYTRPPLVFPSLTLKRISPQVKLIDFGSAVVVDPAEPRPLYTLFFGTTAYAASEVLQKKPYRAPPAEVWTLGVLLSYLLTGASPFPTERDAVAGRVMLASHAGTYVSESAEQLMLRCLDPDPERRADIHEVRTHPWLDGGLDLPLEERIV